MASYNIALCVGDGKKSFFFLSIVLYGIFCICNFLFIDKIISCSSCMFLKASNAVVETVFIRSTLKLTLAKQHFFHD